MPSWTPSAACGSWPSLQVWWGGFGTIGHNQYPCRQTSPQTSLCPTGGPLPQASPVSVYLFPGERSGAQPPSSPVGAPAGSLGSCSEAKEDEKEEEGDGDTLDSDEFCILDAPGLGIPVCDGQAGQAGQGQEVVGADGSVPGPSRVPAVREAGGGHCPWEVVGLGGSSWRGSPNGRL